MLVSIDFFLGYRNKKVKFDESDVISFKNWVKMSNTKALLTTYNYIRAAMNNKHEGHKKQ